MRFSGTNRANLTKKVPTPISTLSLDFVNNLYQYNNVKYNSPSGIAGYNFSNISGGNCFNPNTGLVQYFPPNTPRITNDGCLIEQSASNLCLSSQKMQNATIWTYTFLGTLTDGITTAPDGTLTGARFVATDAYSDFHSGAIAVTANQNYTLSFWVKLGAGASSSKGIKIATTGGVAIGSTGTIAGANTTSWTRVSLTVNVGANTSVLLYPLTLVGAIGTYYIWGVQFELGSFATSYIPTYYATTTNLCQQSNFLATSPWIAIGSATAINNSSIAPDGTFTASTITTTNNLHGYRQPITVTANTTYTWSFYAKLGTMPTASYSVYNITQSTELVVATSYTSKVNANGWSRISVTFTTPTGCTSVGCYPIRDSQSTGTIFIWGCQLETGNTANIFVPCSPAVTNYGLQSQTIASWNAFNTTNTNNTTIAPNGTTTAGTIATTVTGFANAWLNSSYTTVSNTAFTISAYLKANASNFGYINVGTDPNFATLIVNLNTGIITQKTSGGSFSIITTSITSAYNGFYRVSISIMPTNSILAVVRMGNSSSATASLSGVGIPSSTVGNSIYVWGFQLEVGYGPNQYVSTTTTSASAIAQVSTTLSIQTSFDRTADVFTYGSALGLSFSNTKAMVTQGSYLFYPSTNYALAQLSDGTSTNSVLQGEYLGNYLSQIVIGGSLVKSIYQGGNINIPTTNRKQGVSFGDNKMVISQNGNTVADPNMGNGIFAGTISFNQLLIGGTNTVTNPQINGYVKSIKLYSSSMSLNQLNTLTSLTNN